MKEPNGDDEQAPDETPSNGVGVSEKLLRNMKLTKSNRFYYAKRLETQAYTKSTVGSILNLLSIAAGIYIIAYSSEIDARVSALVGAFIAGVSIISLLLGLERPVALLSKRSSDAHRCGREISQIYRELQFGQILPDEAARRYESVMSNYEDNHDEIDHKMTLNQYREIFPEKSKNVRWINSVLPYRISSVSSVFFTLFCLLILVGVWIILPMIPRKIEPRVQTH